MLASKHKPEQLLLVLLFGLAFSAASAKTILGWLEPVSIETTGITLTAKIDTGADNTSVHAVDIEIIEQDGVDKVRFTLLTENGQEVKLLRPLQHVSRIKLKKGGYTERPVVELTLCVGDRRITAPVNLTDRGHFQYSLLIGRSVLRQGFLVDASAKRLTQPVCHSRDQNKDP